MNLLFNEDQDLEIVKQFAEKLGYGYLMQFLSEEWYKKDPIGALTVGRAYSQIQNIEDGLNKLIGNFKIEDVILSDEEMKYVLPLILEER